MMVLVKLLRRPALLFSLGLYAPHYRLNIAGIIIKVLSETDQVSILYSVHPLMKRGHVYMRI